MGGYGGKPPRNDDTQLILDTEDEPEDPCRGVTIIVAAKTVDSYRFLHGIEKRMLICWVSLPRETKSHGLLSPLRFRNVPYPL
jgi:hypothetical protein